MPPKKRQSATDKLEETVHGIFVLSQHQKNVKKCVKDFMKIFKEMHNTPKLEDFTNVLLTSIKQVLICDRNSPFTKKTLDFIATCFKEMIAYEEEFEDERAHRIAAEEALNNQLHDDSMNSTLEDDLGTTAFDLDQTIINSKYLAPISTVDLLLKNELVKFTICKDLNIRYNTLSLLKKTLEYFNEMDEETFDVLRTWVNDRTFDKEKTIRALACLGLEKLQNSEKNDVVMKGLKFHMLRDPDATVRICALKTIEVNTDTVKGMFTATRDECNSIRKSAYSKIAQQSSIVNFTPKDRITLIMNGLNERVDNVREVFLTQLIPNWIKGLDNGIIGFLDNLDIKRNLPLARQFLTTYFTHLKKTAIGNDMSQLHQVVFDFQEKNLDEHRLFTKCPLTEESAFLWFNLCEFCQKSNITYKVETKETNAETGEEVTNCELFDLVDKILPDVPIYTMFVEKLAQKTKEDVWQSGERATAPQFIFEQLLKIGKLYKVKDDAQWNSILTTFKRIIKDDDYFDIFDSYIEHIISILGNYFGNDHEQFLDLIFDLINAINSPHLEVDEEELKRKLEEHAARIHDLVAERNNAVLAEDSTEEARISAEIEKVEQSQQDLIDSQSALDSQVNIPPRMETDDKVFLRILHIFYGFFQAGKLKKDIDRLPTMINKLILPGLQSSDSKIRTLCVKNLGLYCLPSVNLINFFIKVFIEIVDGERFGETRVEALKFIFDFLCYHGFKNINFSTNDFKNTDLHKSSTSSASSQIGDDTDNLLDICDNKTFAYVFSELIEKLLMEGPDLEGREELQRSAEDHVKLLLFDVAAKGTCKIMNLGRFYSDKLLARLIVIHLTFTDLEPEMRQFIEGFLLDYAKTFPMCLRKQFSVESAYVDAYEPSIEVLIDDFAEERDREKWADKMIDFFNTAVMGDQLPNLMLKAASIINNEEFRDVWPANFKLIEKADLKTFDLAQLDELEEQLLMFKEKNVIPVQPRRGRGVRKTGNKNFDSALKLLARIKDRKAHLEKLQQQQQQQRPPQQQQTVAEEPEEQEGEEEDEEDHEPTVAEPPPNSDDEMTDDDSNMSS